MRNWISKVAIVIFLGVSVLPNLASAQNVIFSSIVVEGNQRIETSTILSFAGLETGAAVSPAQINDAYQRLVATGLFEEVALIPAGGRLLIEVKEYPTINRINVEGNKRLKDDALLALVTSQPRRTYSPAQAEADAAAIVEAYRQAGRYSAEVKPVIIRRSDNRIDLVFEVFEGKVIEIQRLSFVGNRNFSDRRLRRVLSTKQAGFFRQFVRQDTFVADRIEFDKQVLRDFYQSRGFIDFQVLSVTSEIARERNGFFLTFKVREGQSYKFGQITTSSDLSEIDTDDFQAVIRAKPGVTYSPEVVETIIERMETLATQKGLNFIRVEPRVTRDDKALTLDLEFVVSRGPRVFVERIDIEGNTTTLDRVVRRQFKTVEGDPFNPREIRAAADRIRALRFFSKSEVRSREGSSPDRLIIDVDVEEQNTGTLSFGASYSGSSGFGGQISLSERNFLGRGQFVSVVLSGGVDNQTVDLTFAEPAFLDRDLRLSLNGYYRTSEQQSAYFDTLEAGFRPELEFPVSERGRVGLRYRLSSDTIQNVSTDSSPLIQADAGGVTTSSIGLSYSYDSRNTGLNPNAGILFSISQDIAGLGGDAQYSKTAALIAASTAVANEEVVLKAELEGGLLHSLSGDSRISDRFFLNKQMRGFQRNGLGPRDTGATNEDALGGNYFAVARFEASFPIGLPEEYGIYGGVFADVGSVWGLDNTAGDATVIDSMKLRSVVGVSLFWESAIGPLRFNFSRVIGSETYDRPENFELTISTRF